MYKFHSLHFKADLKLIWKYFADLRSILSSPFENGDLFFLPDAIVERGEFLLETDEK